MIGGPIEKNIVYFSLVSRSLLYNNSSPYLCFPFIGKLYTCSTSHIKYGSYFFIIGARIFNIKAFSATKEVCNMVSIKIGPLYITSLFLIQLPIFWACWQNPYHCDLSFSLVTKVKVCKGVR
jgi:hypothetical protein